MWLYGKVQRPGTKLAFQTPQRKPNRMSKTKAKMLGADDDGLERLEAAHQEQQYLSFISSACNVSPDSHNVSFRQKDVCIGPRKAEAKRKQSIFSFSEETTDEENKMIIALLKD